MMVFLCNSLIHVSETLDSQKRSVLDLFFLNEKGGKNHAHFVASCVSGEVVRRI